MYNQFAHFFTYFFAHLSISVRIFWSVRICVLISIGGFSEWDIFYNNSAKYGTQCSVCVCDNMHCFFWVFTASVKVFFSPSTDCSLTARRNNLLASISKVWIPFLSQLAEQKKRGSRKTHLQSQLNEIDLPSLRSIDSSIRSGLPRRYRKRSVSGPNLDQKKTDGTKQLQRSSKRATTQANIIKSRKTTKSTRNPTRQCYIITPTHIPTCVFATATKSIAYWKIS